MSESDEVHLQRAVALARETMESGAGRPFGAVVVRDRTVLAEGANTMNATGDPTDHAELIAIREACKALRSERIDGATVYASGEPCPMCLGLMYATGVARYVFASSAADAKPLGSRAVEVYEDLRRPQSERRLIAAEHRPLPEAAVLFDDWLARTKA